MATSPTLNHAATTVIDQLRPGDHLCHLYTSEDEHRTVLTPFVQHGLERGERVLYVADFHTPAEISKYLRDVGLDVDAYLARDQLRLLLPGDAYVQGGTFDPHRMIALLVQETGQALRDGFTALRVTGEMTWALRGLPGSDRLIEYEIALDWFFRAYSALAICQYDRRRFHPDMLLRVIEVHPSIIIGTQVCDNFYFVPPADLARPDRAERQLQRHLDTLTERRQLEAELWQQRAHLKQEVINRTRDLEEVIDHLHREVSQHQQTAQALRQSTAFLKQTQQITQVGGWEYDVATRRILWTDEVYRIHDVDTDYDPSDIGRSISFYAPSDQAQINRAFQRAVEFGESYDLELQFVSAAGQAKWVRTIAQTDVVDGRVVRVFGNIMDVTTRKQTEATLRASEERYRRIFETAEEGIWLIDANSLTTLANDKLARMLGYTVEEMLGQPLFAFMDEEGQAIAAANVERRKQGIKEQHDFKFKHRDGHDVWALLSTNPLLDPAGTYQGALAMITDITERRRAEQTLQARLRLAQFAVDHTLHEVLVATLDEAGQLTGSPIGFYHFLDPDQKTLTLQAWSTRTTTEFCTAAGQGRHYGVDQAGVWVDCVRQRRPIIHNDYAALPAEQRKGLPPGHARVDRELAVPVFRGDLIVAMLGVGNKPQPYDDSDLATVSLLADLAWEVAERKRMAEAEHDQRTQAEALRDTATALNSTLNLDEVFDRILLNIGRVVAHEAVSIMLLDEAAAIARIARYHGYALPGTETLVRGLTFELARTVNLRTLHATRRPLIIADVHDYPGWLTTPERDWIRSYAGVPIRSRERIVGFLNLYSAVPGFYTEAQVERLQAFAEQAAIAVENAQLHARIQMHVDELEQRVAERTLELTGANQKLGAANSRLTELDRLKDEFVSRISHELRTPLTNIRIYLDLLENGKPEKHEKYLRILNDQSARLQGLIESLLDVSRLNVTQADVQLRPINLNDAAADLVNGGQLAAARHGLTLTLAAASERPIVQADALLLPQALSPILSNALTYTPAGGSLTVTTAVQLADGQNWGTLIVRDTGPGIESAEMTLIFERFYRGSAARDYKTPGTGLGLSISRDLIEKCGGHITVESTLGQGAAFTVWLPLT